MKKFLSLVLALIMTMSLVTISAGATEYRDLTDKEEIQYEEAVAVLNRIGVITGYEDGSFRPETELTRGAAAKIIVSLMIGPDAASALPNNASPYPDVPAGHTFAGVIGYCKTAGYISGYGDGTFKPANPLTGYAFAKMLLGAIGYKANVEGFVDTGWTMNVARIGNVAGLFDRLDFDGAAAVTRDEACQLALNTLKATMVDYGGTNTVVSSNGQVLTVQGSKAVYVTSNNRDINANINRRVISATNNELTLEFGEEHFKDLRLEHDRYDPAFDVYGHPSNEWSYKKVTIGTFPLEADFTFTKQMAHREDTVASKEKALGLRGYDTYSTDHRTTSGYSTVNGVVLGADPFADATQVTINGFNARVYNDAYTNNANTSTVKNGNLYAYDAFAKGIGKDNAPSLAEICDLTDNGVTVEVYVCPVDADYITHVVVTRTQLMKVKTIGSDYVALENISPDSKDPRKEGNLSEITGYNAFAIDVDTVDVKDNNYDAYNTLKELKAGTRVAVVPYTTDQGKTWEVGEAYVPETAAGALTKIGLYSNTAKKDGNAVTLTVGGTEYPVAEWNKDIIDADGYQIKATKKDVTVYLDKLGNVLWADEIGNSDAWMVVGDYYQAANSSGKVVWFVHGWTIGGDEVNVDLGTIRGEAEKYAPGELVHYEIAKSGTGEYKLNKPTITGTWKYKNGNTIGWSEPQYTKVDDGKYYKTGEGIYEVSQYARTTKLETKAFAISSGNSDIALENYAADVLDSIKIGDYKVPDQWNYSVTGPKWVNKTKSNDPDWGTDPSNKGQEAAHTFNYNYTTYDGVKFIFVSFDGNGEVETIDFRSGVQNVSSTDLAKFNKNWTNVGTNGSRDEGKFVANAAEAYVNDSGKVKAVVIKSDSPEANLSNVAVITDYVGSDAYQVGANNYTEFTRKYRIGPKFDEELTGTFDRRYDVGDVVTIRSKNADEIITAKPFHGDTYLNTNPDLFLAEGLTEVKTHTGSTNKSAFVVGVDGKLTTADGSVNLLAADLDTLRVPYGVDIMSDDNALGDKVEDEWFQTSDRKGLITVDKDTVFVDQRVGHRDNEIDELADLIDDYELSTAKVKVLVNGKIGGGFRHAYVVVVEYAVPKADNAATPKDVAIDATNKEAFKDSEGNVLYYTIPAEKNVVLTASVSNASKCGTLSYVWTADGAVTGGNTNKITVNLSDKERVTYKVVVTNTDNSKKDKVTAEGSATIILEGKAATSTTTTNVTIQPGKENGANAQSSGAVVDGTGKVAINFNLKMPDFVPTGATATIDYDVKVNGNTMKSATVTSDAVAGGFASKAVADALNNAGGGPAISVGSKVDIVITKIVYDKVVVKYVAADGKTDITTKLGVAASIKEIAVSNNASLTVLYTSADKTNVPAISVVSGATGSTVPAATNNGNASNNISCAITTMKVAGDAAVVIMVNESAMDKYYTITNKLTNGVASGFGVEGATDGAKSLTFTLTGGTNMVKGGNATFKIAGLTTAADAYQYEATITLDGKTKVGPKAIDNTGATDGEATFTIANAGADAEITGLEISVKTPKLAVTSGTFNEAKTTLTVIFNRPVNEGSAKVAFTLTDGTVVQTGKSTTTEVSGNTVTISVIDGTFVGDVVMAATVQDKDIAANTAAAKTFTLPT